MQRSQSTQKGYSNDLLQTIQEKIKEFNLSSQPTIDQSQNRFGETTFSQSSLSRKNSTVSELRRRLLEKRSQNKSIKGDSSNTPMINRYEAGNNMVIFNHQYDSSRNIDEQKSLIYKNAYSNLHKKGNKSMQQTHNDQENQNIKSKLAYEWKNIYRNLSQEDRNATGDGKISIKSFQKALNQNKVSLSKYEISKLVKQFGVSESQSTTNKKLQDNQIINYTNISKQMGLHNNTLELIRPTTTQSSFK
ncbi:UNKNOWN [Stylonychia lemnae]|uniref:EF-hand domain-containing protein n=1 Tax=Stylonychia lemnae TaxID=5949 RepID=A0A078A0V8_STYLE|nr:UNKNOWN [Stylonychia lemnae]|eukprot:CDW74424.1 UNKNOWN [Stylonychia lemnae]